jgi:hypothetical protein
LHPDLPSHSDHLFVRYLSDLVPTVLCVIVLITCIYKRDLVTFNKLVVANATIFILNSVAENLTGLCWARALLLCACPPACPRLAQACTPAVHLCV